MPFVSKAQARACYARKRSNPKSKWNCKEWSKNTDWSNLPEYSPRKRSFKKKSSSKKLSSKKLSSKKKR